MSDKGEEIDRAHRSHSAREAKQHETNKKNQDMLEVPCKSINCFFGLAMNTLNVRNNSILYTVDANILLPSGNMYMYAHHIT